MNQQDRYGYIFGDYLLDPSSSALYQENRHVPLGGRSFEVLRYFVLHPQEVVKKTDLKSAVWQDVRVVDNNVDQQISGLRKILGKTSDGRDYIETVPKDGYRFSVAVELRERPKRRHLPLFIALAAATLLAVIVIAFVYHPVPREPDENTIAKHSSLVLGFHELDLGGALAARPILERAVQDEPSFAPAHAALSSALLSLGYESRAREEAEKAKALLKGLTREDACFVKGQYYESVSDWRNAVKSFETLHALAPDQPRWALRYALALSKSGKQKDALEQLGHLRSKKGEANLGLGLDLVEMSVAEAANDYEREYKTASMAERTAKSKGLLYQAGHAELSEAWALDNQSKLSDAEKAGAAARELLSKIGDEGGAGQAWKLLGDVYADQNRLELASSAYKNAIATCNKIGSLSGEAVALNNFGYVLRDLGDLQGARNEFEQSLSIARSIGNLRSQGLALNGSAIVLKRMGNLAGAEEAYSAAIEIAKNLSENGSLGTRLNNYAIVLQDEGKLDDARKNFHDAMQVFRKLGREADVAMVFGNLGDLELRAGDLPAAEKNYKADIGLGKSIPQPDNLGYGFLGLGEVCFLRGDLKAARRFLDQSFKVRTDLKEAGSASETLLALAEIDLEERNFGAAELKAQDASAEFRKEKQSDQEAVAQAILAESLAGERKLVEAETVAESATKLLNGSEDKDSQLNANLHLWKVSDAVGRRAEAVKLLQSVLSWANQCHYLTDEFKARLFLLELASGSIDSRHGLWQLQTDARAKGFLLIADKASEYRRSLSKQVGSMQIVAPVTVVGKTGPQRG